MRAHTRAVSAGRVNNRDCYPQATLEKIGISGSDARKEFEKKFMEGAPVCSFTLWLH